MNRRNFIKGIAGIIAAASAPAIIPIKSIMPVKQIILPGDIGFKTMAARVQISHLQTEFGIMDLILDDMARAMAKQIDESIIFGNKLN